jgi:hypothetical protein
MPLLQRRGDVLTLTRPAGEDLHPDTRAWRTAVIEAGGTLLRDSAPIADGLVRALTLSTFDSKVIWLLPLLGANLAAAITPLRDSLGAGRPSAYGLLDADFSQRVGLQGNGTTKYLDTLITPAQLGTAGNGGLGWWELAISYGGNVEPIGCYNTALTNRFVLDLRSSLRSFWWGGNTTTAGQVSAAANEHYYGQRSSATRREFYVSGQLMDVDTANDAASGAGDKTIHVLGSREASVTPWPGRCGVAYLTDGTLTPAEADQVHTILRETLLRPTGRI